MTADVLAFPRLRAVPQLPKLLASWNPSSCPNWCAGGHDIPGADHSHWQTIQADMDASNGHWIAVSLQEHEHAAGPVVALDIDDRADCPEMTIHEARVLIRALRRAVRMAKKGKKRV